MGSNEQDQQPGSQPPTDVVPTATDLSAVEGCAVESVSVPQNNSLFPIDTSSPPADKFPVTTYPDVMELIKELKGEVSGLDEKITLMTESGAQAHDSMNQRMGSMEAKLTGLEGKLDKMVVQLQQVMDALLAARS